MYQSSNRILFFLALITGAYLFPACNNQAPPQPLEEVEDIELLMSDFQIAGLSVAVIKDFQIEFLEHHGVTDQRQKDDVTASTLFQVGDISKSVTSMAALAFSAEGKIPLTVDINNYLTSWQLEENNNTAIQKVTLGRLLTHTGGINEETFAGYVEGESVPSLFQLLNGQSPANNNPIQVTATPGTQFNYSSGGHLVIQQAMEDVSGTDFASLMKTRIFDPIGMVSSAFEQPLSANKQVVAASGHTAQTRVLDGKYYTYPQLAPLGLWSTAEDMGKFLIEIQNSARGQSNQVLDQSNAANMISSLVVNGFGVGFFLQDIGNETYFLETGTNSGYTALIFGHKELGIGTVILTNGEDKLEFVERMLNIVATHQNWPGF